MNTTIVYASMPCSFRINENMATGYLQINCYCYKNCMYKSACEFIDKYDRLLPVYGPESLIDKLKHREKLKLVHRELLQF